jgi:hypothetical protein
MQHLVQLIGSLRQIQDCQVISPLTIGSTDWKPNGARAPNANFSSISRLKSNRIVLSKPIQRLIKVQSKGILAPNHKRSTFAQIHHKLEFSRPLSFSFHSSNFAKIVPSKMDQNESTMNQAKMSPSLSRSQVNRQDKWQFKCQVNDQVRSLANQSDLFEKDSCFSEIPQSGLQSLRRKPIFLFINVYLQGHSWIENHKSCITSCSPFHHHFTMR